jgi:hypothetical protein
MTDADSKYFRGEIFEIIENQMSDGTPPETKQTYDRLIAEGYSREETMKLIGCVVTSEIFHVLRQKQPFNQERYVAALQALPKMPWGDDNS